MFKGDSQIPLGWGNKIDFICGLVVGRDGNMRYQVTDGDEITEK